MSFRYEVRLSGEGGQGMVLAGKILAEAAAIHAGLNATQSQSYGPEARGGASRSEVIISDEDIDYPKAIAVDVMLALTQASYDAYRSDVKPDGIMIVDSDEVVRLSDPPFKVCGAPIVRLATQEIGRPLFANVVAVGLVVGLSKIVPVEAARAAVAERAPKGTEGKNLQALELGLAKAAEF